MARGGAGAASAFAHARPRVSTLADLLLLQAVLGGKATPSAADVKAILTSGARRAGRARARAPGDGHSHAKALGLTR